MRWRERQELECYAIEIHRLMGLLPLKFKSPAHAKRSLNRAHQELIEIGHLRGVEYVEKPVGGRYGGGDAAAGGDGSRDRATRESASGSPTGCCDACGSRSGGP